MKSLSAYASEQETLGYFRIFATPPGQRQREITMFRGVPVKIGTVSTQDPFTESTASLVLPQVTVFDTPGSGDLDWLVPSSDIDIVWENVGGYDLTWSWEGYIASYSFNLSGQDSSFSMDLKGAFYGLDDYLAIPRFPKRPIPYEILIAQAFDQDQHPTHLGRLRMLFPSDWGLKVPAFKDPTYLTALKPWGVATGQLWTGFTARNTGSWEPLLTGFVQSLLTVMFAEGGSQWTIRNRGHRRPELFLRKAPNSNDEEIIEVYLGAPGVTMDGSRDFTQRAGVIYGSGQDEAGIAFSNVQVSPNGRNTFYKPFAYSSRMWPRKNNPSYDPNLKPKETMIRFQDGVDEVSALKIAQGQYQRFAEPGITGSVTLTTDPRLASGALMPRLMIRGGQTIRLNGLFGVREGVLAHVTQASADFTNLTTTLTFDTKYRDQLTVDEVRARTRDALTPMRALQVGKYSNTIQDLVLPWSYKAGSGIVPTPAQHFYDKLPPTATFPFEEFTKRYPPKDPKSKNWYIEIGPTDTADSSNNWSAVKRDGQATMAIPIRMSQAGSIRLTQLAAYDKHGNVMPVKFHYSVYYSNGTAENGMPQFPGKRSDPDFPRYLKARQKGLPGVRDRDRPVIPTTYETSGKATAQAHPFYEGGWETVQPDGTQFPWGSDVQLADANDGLIVGWGNYHEPAGYSPGRFSKGADRTGLLEDNAAWSWDVVGHSNLDLQDPDQNVNEEYAGMLFVMIYCDDQLSESVYFQGRFIRNEPGQS
jgi:hypothetical protein